MKRTKSMHQNSILTLNPFQKQSLTGLHEKDCLHHLDRENL